MSVKSTFTSVLTSRMVKSTGLAILMAAFFTISSSFRDPVDPTLLSKEVNILIRQIGHRLLLQAGDSTSRVLPVKEIKEGTFLLRFENKMNFNHDSLQQLALTLLPKPKFPAGYTVTVHDCGKGDIVYGFQINNATPDILACSGRNQPQGCYTMEFAFADLYKNMILEKAASILRNNGSVLAKVEPQGANSKPESLENELSRKRNEGNSIKVDSQAVDPKGEILNPAISNNPLKYVAYGSLLVLLITGFLFWRFRNNLRPVPMQNQGKPIINESTPELPALGKFLFNVKGQRLLISDEVISLTDKECKVLELLHKNFGELIPRETLMQEVWINEGVITGRSLDMFVSKLRKKLSADPELRITNIHGKGYKLEIPERQVI